MLPLNGIKVVELAQNLSGPYACQILATMGADVVKIERPKGGDDARYWGQQLTPDASHLFHAVNYNKRSVSVDLTDRDAIAWLKNLIAESDVLIQNLRPGVVEDHRPRRDDAACGQPTPDLLLPVGFRQYRSDEDEAGL